MELFFNATINILFHLSFHVLIFLMPTLIFSLQNNTF